MNNLARSRNPTPLHQPEHALLPCIAHKLKTKEGEEGSVCSRRGRRLNPFPPVGWQRAILKITATRVCRAAAGDSSLGFPSPALPFSPQISSSPREAAVKPSSLPAGLSLHTGERSWDCTASSCLQDPRVCMAEWVGDGGGVRVLVAIELLSCGDLQLGDTGHVP